MKRIKILFAVILVSSAITGCIHEEIPQGGTIGREQVGASGTSVLGSMVNAIPAAMMSANTAGYFSTYGVHIDFGIPAIHIMTENMLEDLATMGDNPLFNRFYAYAENSEMGTRFIYCSYFWQCYYAWIKMANEVISLADEKTADAGILGLLGQAYAYRAMFYLDLVRMYEPKENGLTEIGPSIRNMTVPLVTQDTSEEMAKNNPRQPREKMYAFILEDLARAENLINKDNKSFTTPTLAAVYGLYARAYLEMGYWDEDGDDKAFISAAEYARKAIETSGKTPLTEAQWQDPIYGFNNGMANNAWIWGLTLSSENTSNLLNFTAHMSCEAAWGYAPLAHTGVNKRLYDRISTSDFRKYSWIDPSGPGFYRYRFAGSPADQASFLSLAMPYESIKFRPAQGECADYIVGSCADHPLMRVEEMYFIEMEATAHTDLAKAKELLKEFMNKYRYTDGSFNNDNMLGIDSFLSDMLFQKRVEFWGEGILFFDYKRLDMKITRGYTGTNHAGSYALNTERRSPQWNIVITRAETLNNNAIGDNENNPDPSGTIKLWGK